MTEENLYELIKDKSERIMRMLGSEKTEEGTLETISYEREKIIETGKKGYSTGQYKSKIDFQGNKNYFMLHFVINKNTGEGQYWSEVLKEDTPSRELNQSVRR